MSNLEPLLERNRVFAQTGAHLGLPPSPKHQVFIITCMDGRVDPAHVLGAELGDAIVFRNGGGRVTHDVLREIAFVAAVSTIMSGGQPPAFEVAVIHHTSCGSAFLADEAFRGSLAQTTGHAESDLAALAVTDPFRTIADDVDTLLSSDLVPATVAVSGHVYDVDTGLVTIHRPSALEASVEMEDPR